MSIVKYDFILTADPQEPSVTETPEYDLTTSTSPVDYEYEDSTTLANEYQEAENIASVEDVSPVSETRYYAVPKYFEPSDLFQKVEELSFVKDTQFRNKLFGHVCNRIRNEYFHADIRIISDDLLYVKDMRFFVSSYYDGKFKYLLFLYFVFRY